MKVALDFDGTIVSCEARHCAVARAALASCSPRASFDPGAFWRLKRRGQTTLQAYLGLGLPPGLSEQAAWLWRARIEEPFWLSMDTVLPGALESLEKAVGRGLDLALVSARSIPSFGRWQLQMLGLERFFAEMRFVAGPAAASKALAIRESGAAAYIGDTELDYDAAVRAGVKPLLVASGMRTREFLLERLGVGASTSITEVFSRELA